MVKNKSKFLRRCGSVIAAAVVLLCCLAPMMAAPASAASGSFPVRSTYYVGLRFDYIVGVNASNKSQWWVAWDFNEFDMLGNIDPVYKIVTGTGATGFGYEGDTEIVNYPDGRQEIVSSIKLTHQVSQLDSVTLYAEELVLHVNDLDSFYSLSVGDEFTQDYVVTVQFDYCFPLEDYFSDDDVYRLSYAVCYKVYDVHADDAEPFNLMGAIRSQLVERTSRDDVPSYNSSDFVLIRNLSVKLQCPRPLDASTGILTLRSTALNVSDWPDVNTPSHSRLPGLDDWFNSWGIPVYQQAQYVSFPSVSDFLIESVSGFFDAQIVPGISFGGLLSFIIGLALFVIFTKAF